MVLGVNAFSQSSNPYNDIGKKYFESVNNIVADIQANGFKGNDQKSLDYYASLSSLPVKINPDLAAKIYETNSNKKINPIDIIKNSTLSEQSKEFTLKIILPPSKLSISEATKYFENLGKEIKNSKISEDEKSLNLSLLSITNTASQNRGHEGEKGCTLESNTGSTWLEPWKCVGIGAAVGAYIGWHICGGWCALGGAIVMGVITAIAVC